MRLVDAFFDLSFYSNTSSTSKHLYLYLYLTFHLTFDL